MDMPGGDDGVLRGHSKVGVPLGIFLNPTCKNLALSTSCFWGSLPAADPCAAPCFLSLSFLIWGK